MFKRKNQKEKRALLADILSFLIMAVVVFIALPSGNVSADTIFHNPLNAETPTEILSAILKFIVLIAIPALALAFAFVAVALVKDSDDPGKRADHIKALGGIALGGGVVVGASWLADVLVKTVKDLEP